MVRPYNYCDWRREGPAELSRVKKEKKEEVYCGEELCETLGADNT
jgi:hypothetical protein